MNFSRELLLRVLKAFLAGATVVTCFVAGRGIRDACAGAVGAPRACTVAAPASPNSSSLPVRAASTCTVLPCPEQATRAAVPAVSWVAVFSGMSACDWFRQVCSSASTLSSAYFPRFCLLNWLIGPQQLGSQSSTASNIIFFKCCVFCAFNFVYSGSSVTAPPRARSARASLFWQER